MITASSKEHDQDTRRRVRGARHHPHQRHHKDDGDEDADQEAEADDIEREEKEKDCFFESFDRVPSNVSFVVDLPSESDDDEEEDEDVRISFASAISPPTDFRCVTFSREQFLIEHNDEEEEEEEAEAEGGRAYQGSYDYDIWMAEPTSITERRRRLLQGMGFASNKDLAAAIRSRSRKAVERPADERPADKRPADGRPADKRPAAINGVHIPESARPLAIEVASPVPLPRKPPVARCRSDTELATTRRSQNPAKPVLPRSTSAPPTMRDHRERQVPGATDSAGTAAAEQGGGLVLSSGGVFRIKNLDTGKEFVVREFIKDGNWGLKDIKTGLQITMEEFEQVLGYSPIVKELMLRANLRGDTDQQSDDKAIQSLGYIKRSTSKSGFKKKGSWFKNIKFVASSVAGRITEKEKDARLKSIGRSSSDGSELMKVRQHGKSYKELTGLYMSQEIHAHEGSIWCIKFSLDGRYLASAGEDRVVRVWEVLESDIPSTPLRRQEARSLSQSRFDGSPERFPLLGTQPSKWIKKVMTSRRSMPDYIVMPELVFSLSDKPICSLEGHLDDVLDLSWSKSKHLLSSSMDKTVRLWDMESKACLKLFEHNDYVTCIQFNPIDDRYFISGSLDAKVRTWSIPEHHVVDWSDLHEMVTAACYTPDGQGALVGSHKGSCRFYKTSDCKLSPIGQMCLRKKNKTNAKKITGFQQFAPGNPSEVMITSADSRVRVFDNLNMIHKFRGFRNTTSQISASYTSDGKYVICASEDSHVYVWKREPTRIISSGSGSKTKGWTTTRSHEYFYCKDVSVAIPWPSAGSNCSPMSLPPFSQRFNQQDPLGSTDSQRSTTSMEEIFHSKRSQFPPLPKKSFSVQALSDELRKLSHSGPEIGSKSFASGSASLKHAAKPSSMSPSRSSSFSSWGWYNGGSTRSSSTDPSNAWGLVLVTAGLGGDIRIYQNFGLPLRLNRQTNLF
ncbi:WD repeat-containing protein 44-like [Canna indica]|uniref:WD repeat-containing protein 44-like n=1 Tax=Canna indica TaxID=4628 RepID=A0AAQ3L2J2_9LILI|nr:WD repeat-containing protein 44-like [Canna indica]